MIDPFDPRQEDITYLPQPSNPADFYVDPPEPDLHVSESDARRMQQRYDNWLERESA